MPGYGIVRGGAEVIGRPWTRYLALSGRIIDAATAERIGLVQHTVPPDADLLPAALTLAEEVAAHPPPWRSAWARRT